MKIHASRSFAAIALLVIAFTGCETPSKAEADTAAGTQRPARPAPPPRREERTLAQAGPLMRAEEIVRNRHAETLIAITRELVRHPTFVDERDTSAEPRAREAFMQSLRLRAESLGLSFTRVTPFSAEVELASDVPDAKRVIGILAHGDVVPPGDGWSHAAFAGELTDGRIWGRGTLDDKGPIAAALVAMAAARDSRIPRPFITRLIVGMAEETSWQCMDGYLQARTPPDFTFVVDGSFPVGVGEKGIVNVKVAERFMLLAPSSGRCVIADIKGGTVGTMVPASAEAVLQCNGVVEKVARDLTAAGMTVSVQGDRVRASVLGRAAHGSTPEQGINAITLLLNALDRAGALDDAQGGVLLLRFLARRGADLTGDSLGVYRTHPRFTPTTVNLGKLRIEGSTIIGTLNVRMPPPTTIDEIKGAVQASADAFTSQEGIRSVLVVEGGGLNPLDVDPTLPEVQALMTAYKNVLKREPRAVTLAGTTYAKAIPHAVSFGPEEDGTPERRHAADEFITVDELVDLASVYAAAITTLAQMPVTP